MVSDLLSNMQDSSKEQEIALSDRLMHVRLFSEEKRPEALVKAGVLIGSSTSSKLSVVSMHGSHISDEHWW